MKNKVLKQMLAFSLAVALVGGNSVATFAAEPTNGTESSTNTQAATDATVTFKVDQTRGYFTDFPETDKSVQNYQDYAITYFPPVVANEGYVWTGWTITDQNGSKNVGTEYAGAKTLSFSPKDGNVDVVATFKKTVTEKNATLVVKYVDENGKVGNLQKITRKGNEGEEYTFNITDLNVPDGYELVKATWEKSVAYGNAETVNVEVKKKEAKKADAVLRVHYVDENGTPLDGSQYIVSLTKNGTVGEKATFAATSFTAPEGYELVGGDITDVEVAYGKDKDVNVKVKAIKEEKEARDVIVNFNVAPEEGQFKDPAGAKVVTYTIKEDSADQFLVPTVEAKEGYEFTGWLVNGTVNNHMKHKRRYRRYRNKKKKAYILAALILCIVIAAVAVFAISRMAGKEQTSKNQTEVKALVINAEKVDESKLKDLIESAGKINQSVYTDETVNTLNQAKEEAEETIQGKPNQEEVEDSYLNLVNAIQSLQKK